MKPIARHPVDRKRMSIQTGRQAGRNALHGHRTFPRVHLCERQTGDRSHAPDSRALRASSPCAGRRSGLRRQAGIAGRGIARNSSRSAASLQAPGAACGAAFFRAPGFRRTLDFEAPPPDDFQELLAVLRAGCGAAMSERLDRRRLAGAGQRCRRHRPAQRRHRRTATCRASPAG